MNRFRPSTGDASAPDGVGGGRLRLAPGIERFLQASRPAVLACSAGAASPIRRLRAVSRIEAAFSNGLGRRMTAHHLIWEFSLPGEGPDGLREEALILLN